MQMKGKTVFGTNMQASKNIMAAALETKPNHTNPTLRYYGDEIHH